MSIVGPAIAIGMIFLAVLGFVRMLWKDRPKRGDRYQGPDGDFGSSDPGLGH